MEHHSTLKDAIESILLLYKDKEGWTYINPPIGATLKTLEEAAEFINTNYGPRAQAHACKGRVYIHLGSKHNRCSNH